MELHGIVTAARENLEHTTFEITGNEQSKVLIALCYASLMNNAPETAEIAAQTHKVEERTVKMEMENNELRTRNNEPDQKREKPMVKQREAKEENDALAQKNAELVQNAVPVQSQLEQAMQKETDSARTEDYNNELLQKRIASLEQELSQHESVREQYATLKTLHQRQMEALMEKLQAATSRADSAETDVMSLKYQIKLLEGPRFTGNVFDPSLPKCCFRYVALRVAKLFVPPEGGAELDAFVADLFKGGEELCFPDMSAPPKLFPTIIQAFKVRSAPVNFRPLRFSSGVWPAVAERSIRPCPFCVAVIEQSNDSIDVPHVTDRYHVHNALTGQQLTIEFSYGCHRPDDVYGDPEEYWAREEIVCVRILVDDVARCRPELPERPQRKLKIIHQEDLLLAVFDFASRDDLDAAQLTCTSWRDVVSNASGTLALRPLQHVDICWSGVAIQRAPVSEVIPAASFDASWRHWIPNYDQFAFRPEDCPTVMSPLRHGCAVRLESDCIESRFCPIAQHLAGTFHAKSIVLQYTEKLEEITSSLQLAGAMGVKDFDLRAYTVEDTVPLILGNEVLLRAEHLHLRIE
ncbi:hypothetical protein AAVH_30159, partial [Aphelenchoides avenae]